VGLVQLVLDLFAPSGQPSAQDHASTPMHRPAATNPPPGTGLTEPPGDAASAQRQRLVTLDQEQVPYVLVRARRRTIGMLVGPDGLEVRAPRWVSLREIEAALQEKGDWIVRKLAEVRDLKRRQMALDVMHRLQEFKPRLVGAVLAGTATAHDDVILHVFADRIETITLRLLEHGVPFELGERRTRLNSERVVNQPSVRLEVDDQPVELVVFGIDGIRQAPVSPIDGKPMRRADANEVATLL